MIRNSSAYDDERSIITSNRLLFRIKEQFFHWRNNKLHIYRNLNWTYKIRFVLFFVFFHPIYLTGILFNMPILLLSIYLHTSYALTIVAVFFWPLSVCYALFVTTGSVIFGFHTDPYLLQFVRIFYSIFVLTSVFISLLWYEIKVIKDKSMNIQLKIALPVMQILSVSITTNFIMTTAKQTGLINLGYSIILLLEAMFILPLSLQAIYYIVIGSSFWLLYIFTMYCFLLYILTMVMILSISNEILERQQSDIEGTDSDGVSRFKNIMVSIFGSLLLFGSKLAGVPSYLIAFLASIRTAKIVQEQITEPVQESGNEEITCDTEPDYSHTNTTVTSSVPPPKSSPKRIQYVVDGSNICWEGRNQEEGPDIGRVPRLIIQLREQYSTRMEDIVVYVSPALRHQLKSEGDLEIFDILMANKTIKQGPAQEDDDIFIIQQALSNPNIKIISNDLYRDNYENFEGLEDFVKKNRVSVSYDDFNQQFLFGSNI